MSGECDECGEHALECNNKFYYQGKFFETEDEFWAFVKEFNQRQTTPEDFDSLFNMVKKDVWMSLSMGKPEIRNQELSSILEEAFFFISERIWTKSKNDIAPPTSYETDKT